MGFCITSPVTWQTCESQRSAPWLLKQPRHRLEVLGTDFWDVDLRMISWPWAQTVCQTRYSQSFCSINCKDIWAKWTQTQVSQCQTWSPHWHFTPGRWKHSLAKQCIWCWEDEAFRGGNIYPPSEHCLSCFLNRAFHDRCRGFSFKSFPDKLRTCTRY